MLQMSASKKMSKNCRHSDRKFGGFDTWVNNAGVSIYGKTTEVTIKDMRRMFDTVFGVSFTVLELQ